MDIQNINLAVPKHVLRKLRQIALRRGKSVSGLIVEMMEEAISREEGDYAAQQRTLRQLDSATDLGLHGNITWKRDDLHER